MKKALVILALILLVIGIAFADNLARIEELKARQQAIILEVGQRQDVINAQQQVIDGLRLEYTKIQGAIEELERQDAENSAKDGGKK